MKIAITGMAGAGKTYVAEILRSEGYFVFDVDAFSKKVVADEQIKLKLKELFFCNKIDIESFDYKYIGSIFEKNAEIEEEFENWYQPYLGKRIIQELEHSLVENEYVFCDVPYLNKKNIDKWFDVVWLIETTEELSLERIITRNHYSKEKIKKLINESKMIRSDFHTEVRCIDNTLGYESLRMNIKKELGYLRRKKLHIKY